MQNMFELCYFSGQRELIPTGWTAVDESKTYPSLASRNPQIPQSAEELENGDYDMANDKDTSETSDEDEKPSEVLANTRMTEESSDEMMNKL